MDNFISKKQVDDYRRRKWRLGPRRRIGTIGQMADFLDEVGMCLLFACRDIPLPKLDDCGGEDFAWWPWKDQLQEKKKAYNGRLVRRKATIVSMKLLPAFYCVYLTGGGHAMYEEEYYWGKLGELANKIAEHLDRNGPTPTDVLRKAVVPAGKQNTRRFHAALFELQSKFKIVSAGLVDRSWGVRVLNLFTSWVPARIERSAEKMGRNEAMRRICTAFVDTAGAVPEPALARMFGWPATETSSVVNSLVYDGLLLHARFRNDRKNLLVSPKL